MLTKVLALASVVTVLAAGVGTRAGAGEVVRPSLTRPVADHTVLKRGRIEADDLTHGSGWAMVSVRRTWAGGETLDTHFGPGWSDPNVIWVGEFEPGTLVVWRGGLGWRVAHPKGRAFETNGGEVLSKMPQGWILQTKEGGTLAFDDKGRLASETLALGPPRTYAYDGQGRLASLQIDKDNFLRYQYDAQGRVAAVEGPEGLRATYQYDAAGRLATVTNSRRIQVSYRYRQDGALEAATDQFGGVLVPQAKAAAPPGAPEAPGAGQLDEALPRPEPEVVLDKNGLVQETRVGGLRTTYTYDKTGRVATVTRPEGTEWFRYDAFGRVTQVLEPDQRTTQIEYGPLGLPTCVVQPDGSWEKCTYDEHGRLTRREESSGEWEEMRYDAAGRLAASRTSPGLEARYTYDDADRVTQIVYSDGREVRYTYDAAGHRTGERWSSGEQCGRTYDGAGNLTEEVTPHGLRIRYAYDAQGRLVESADEVHGKATTKFLGVGLAKTVDLEGLGSWSYQSTPDDKPLLVKQPSGQETRYLRNELGLPVSVTGPSGLSWRYGYDAAGRLTGVESPAGLKTAVQRDAAGRITKIQRGTVAWREYVYDASGRLAQEKSPAGLAASCRYDDRGRLGELTLPDGKVTYGYADGGLVASIKGAAFSLEQQFYLSGELARQVYQPAGLTLSLPLDRAGRAAGVELNGIKAAYGYDARGVLDRIDLPGGIVVRIATDAAGRATGLSFGPALQIGVSYDRADRIMAIEARGLGGGLILTERYTYDAAGNLTALQAGNWAARFAYDREDRLVSAEDGRAKATFDYDLDGNLKAARSKPGSTPWQLDPLGRPVLRETTAYDWDAAGNLASVAGLDERVENGFDAAGRLVRRAKGDQLWQFGYLPEGDRLWQEGPGGKTYYAYGPEGLVGLKDEAGVAWLLVCLPGTDWPLALCGSNGQTLLLVADRLGSIRRIVQPTGAVAGGVDYDQFGNVAQAAGAAPLRLFAGMVCDPTGLHYARARYYDPELARFISMDPEIGSGDFPASHNPYAYAANNPLRYRDRIGLTPQPAGGGWIPTPGPELLPHEIPPRVPPRPPTVPPGILPRLVGGVRGAGSALWRGAGWVGRGLLRGSVYAAGAWGAWQIGSYVYYGVQKVRAEWEGDDAEATTRRMLDDIREKLTKLREENPGRLLPRGADGQPLSQRLLEQRVYENVHSRRHPFDGIVTPLGTTVDPRVIAGLQQALITARGLISRGNVLRGLITQTRGAVAQQEAAARRKISDASAEAAQMPSPPPDPSLPTLTTDAHDKIAAVGRQKGELATAAEDMRKAANTAERHAETIKGFAMSCARTPGPSQAEVTRMRTEARRLIIEMGHGIDNAATKVAAASVSTDDLVSVKGRARSLGDMIRDVISHRDRGLQALAAAQTATNEASDARTRIRAYRAELDGIPGTVTALLSPFLVGLGNPPDPIESEPINQLIGEARALPMTGAEAPSALSAAELATVASSRTTLNSLAIADRALQRVGTITAEVDQALRDVDKDVGEARRMVDFWARDAAKAFRQAILWYPRIRVTDVLTRLAANPVDLRIVLTWSRPCDVDLHVVEPHGEESYFGHQAAKNGVLDHDDTKGTGPETYALKPNAQPGNYEISLVFYSDPGSTRARPRPVTAQVQIIKDFGRPNQQLLATYTRTLPGANTSLKVPVATVKLPEYQVTPR